MRERRAAGTAGPGRRDPPPDGRDPWALGTWGPGLGEWSRAPGPQAEGPRFPRGPHRAGLELLRLALNDDGSPWAHVLDSVSATLPALAGYDRETVLRRAAQGPPEEQVGLDPYASPVFLPAPS
ncbi:hypothetical protein [Streptomyces prasinopilosus]|uniref:hypothetical protein n=1 Tax=Streptomyces prasinopilosus TaxID=67344 RepID=UPI0006EB32C8|nr:hypothetical protein [Streptomyces prasinopilosus]